MIQRNPMAELNRLVSTIPLHCGNTTIAGLDSALKQVSHTELQKTLKEEIPETLGSTRQKFFTEHREGYQKPEMQFCRKQAYFYSLGNWAFYLDES